MSKTIIIEKYKKYLIESNKGFKTITINRFVSYAKKFIQFLEEKNIYLNDISSETIEEYIKEKPQGERNRRFSINPFIEYLKKENIINLSRNINLNIENPQNKYSELIEKYLSFISKRDVSERTIDIIRSLIKRFLNYLEQHNIHDIRQVTKKIINDYNLYLLLYQTNKKKPYNVTTRANILINIKAFFDFLCKENILFVNPAKDIELPKIPKKISRDIPTLKEIDLILSTFKTHRPTELRNFCIIETMYSTGLRVMEIINLKINDIDFENMFITVRKGKNKKDRVVPINAFALNWIKDYLNKARPVFISKNNTDKGFLFLESQNGKKISTDSIGDMITRHTKKAGIDKHFIPHSFRYACATHMLKNGADIRYIQEMLGHKLLTSTQQYTRVLKGDLKRMIRKFHPREIQLQEELYE